MEERKVYSGIKGLALNLSSLADQGMQNDSAQNILVNLDHE